MTTSRILLVAALGLAPLVAGAGDDAGAADAPLELTLQVGKALDVCATGTILCPASNARCDDPRVVVGEMTEAGLVFRGLMPGTTLCSAASLNAQGLRRVYRITVLDGGRAPAK
jgi:hypothetical protein